MPVGIRSAFELQATIAVPLEIKSDNAIAMTKGKGMHLIISNATAHGQWKFRTHAVQYDAALKTASSAQ